MRTVLALLLALVPSVVAIEKTAAKKALAQISELKSLDLEVRLGQPVTHPSAVSHVSSRSHHFSAPRMLCATSALKRLTAFGRAKSCV